MDDSLQKLIDKANQGDVEAMVMLSKYYKNGVLTKRDDAKAHEYALMAAQKGHSGAELGVGIEYCFGIGTEKNVALGIEYLRRAADKNVIDAQYTLAAVRDGMPEAEAYIEADTAVFYLEKAAKRGHAASQNYLGCIYSEGKMVERELEQAIFWWCCAYLHHTSAMEESESARNRLNFLLNARGNNRISRTKIEDVLNKIRTEYPEYIGEELQQLIEKSKQGDVEAMVNVAECYNHGWFVEKDDRKANEYYRMAAERGHAESEFMLGLAYLDGIGIGKDMSMAVRYIQRSADKGVVNAQYVLGTLYQMDEARQYLKVGKAFDYFEKAAKKGHAKAQIELGDIYIMGDNIEADLSKGVFWLSCAYMQSDSPEENKAAKDRLDRLVRSGMPGGRTRVEQAMEEIRTNYPQYIHISKKRDNACLPEITYMASTKQIETEVVQCRKGKIFAVLYCISVVVIVTSIVLITKHI